MSKERAEYKTKPLAISGDPEQPGEVDKIALYKQSILALLDIVQDQNGVIEDLLSYFDSDDIPAPGPLSEMIKSNQRQKYRLANLRRNIEILVRGEGGEDD